MNLPEERASEKMRERERKALAESCVKAVDNAEGHDTYDGHRTDEFEMIHTILSHCLHPRPGVEGYFETYFFDVSRDVQGYKGPKGVGINVVDEDDCDDEYNFG